MQSRVYRRSDLCSLRMLETGKSSANVRPTREIYAAEIEGRAVTVVITRILSESKDEILNPKDTCAASDTDGPPTNLTLLKRVL